MSVPDKFWAEFDLGNAAFEGEACPGEVARILRQVADRVEAGHDEGLVHDVNGNKVGAWTLDLPEDDEDGEGGE